MSAPVDLVRSRLAEGGCKPSRGQNKFTAVCPAHTSPGSKNKSLSVSRGRDDRALLKCHWDPPCSPNAIVAALGLSMSDLFADDGQSARPRLVDRLRRQVAAYGYHDEQGTLLYEAVRYEPKEFRQRRPDGAGGWIWSTTGVRRVPYRLPHLVQGVTAGRVVFVVEGEKDADRLAALGLVATCNVGGAGKWSDEYSDHFEGAHVAIIPDNDDAGRAHAATVAAALQPVAAWVRLVELSDQPHKGDVADWLDAGNTRVDLEQLVNAAVDLSNDVIAQLGEIAAQVPALAARRRLLTPRGRRGSRSAGASSLVTPTCWSASAG
jgi:hypothetical protein